MTCTSQPEIRPASREAFFVPLRMLGYESHEVESIRGEHGGVYVTRFAIGPDGEAWYEREDGEVVPFTETVFHPFDDMQDDTLSDEA